MTTYVGLWVQAAVPNPLDGLKRSAEAAKSAVSSPAPQKVTCFGYMHALVRRLVKHTAQATIPVSISSTSVGGNAAQRRTYVAAVQSAALVRTVMSTLESACH
jgi:hypothetical protein